jgi:1,4-dihydroxy-2-naphthoate octaprenyltransferase
VNVVTVIAFAESLRKVRSGARVWLIEIRPKFLLISVALALLGTSIAWRNGFFSLRYAVLAFIGLVLWQISVQVLNDYFDYKSGVDLKTQRTPFTGGSGILPAHLLKPGSVLKFGLLSFALAVPIWVYLIIVKGLLLLPLIGVGAVCVLVYTPFLTRWRLGEVSSALGLGILPILMFYFVQTGSYSVEAVVAAIPAGMLIFDVHLLNEFPDVEADKTGGDKTLPIILGRPKAAWLYLAGTVAVYAWSVAWAAAGVMPLSTLISLVTIPLALWAIKGALSYRADASFNPALWANAFFGFFTIILLASGYILAHLFFT